MESTSGDLMPDPGWSMDWNPDMFAWPGIDEMMAMPVDMEASWDWPGSAPMMVAWQNPMGKGMGWQQPMPTGYPTQQPWGKPTGKPMGQPMGKPMGKPMGQPMGKPMSKAWAPGHPAHAPMPMPPHGKGPTGGATVGPIGGTVDTTPGHGAFTVAPPTYGVAMHPVHGAVRIPGFSISLDSPLLQGNMSWPGIMGGMLWPGMMAIVHPPGVHSSGMAGDMHAWAHWPGGHVPVMPDDPVEETEE